jgi:hypothetical protein
MSRYTRLCPSCGGKLDAKTAPILSPSSYSCPFCGVPLQVASDNTGAAYAISLVLSAALTFYLGFRGFMFGLLTILGSLLVLLALSFIQGLVRPARLELRPPTDSSLRLPKSRDE